MRRYRTITAGVFGVILIAGGIVHFVLGRAYPDGYAVFADSALVPGLSSLWGSFVMPNIGWLTIVLGCLEVAAGVGMFFRRTRVMASWGILAFLVFITVLGYGLATASLGEDLLKNRAITLVMIALLAPVALAKPGSAPPAGVPR
jgi:uncharacterized membrane protein